MSLKANGKLVDIVKWSVFGYWSLSILGNRPPRSYSAKWNFTPEKVSKQIAAPRYEHFFVTDLMLHNSAISTTYIIYFYIMYGKVGARMHMACDRYIGTVKKVHYKLAKCVVYSTASRMCSESNKRRHHTVLDYSRSCHHVGVGLMWCVDVLNEAQKYRLLNVLPVRMRRLCLRPIDFPFTNGKYAFIISFLFSLCSKQRSLWLIWNTQE